MRALGSSVAAALLFSVSRLASAQEAPAPEAAAAEPAAAAPAAEAPAASSGGEGIVGHDLQAKAGGIVIHAHLGINLSKEFVGKPISLAPDIYYGVTDDLQVGLLHSGRLGSQTPGLLPEGLCLTGKSNGCPKVYNNVGFDALYAFMKGDTQLSAHGSVFVESLDPATVTVALGVAGKVKLAPNMALKFDPKLLIGATERDAGNKEAIVLPAEFQMQLAPQFALLGQVAVYGPLDGFGDSYRIPVGVAGVFSASEKLDVGARFGLDNLLGKSFGGAGRADYRSLTLFGSFRI